MSYPIVISYVVLTLTSFCCIIVYNGELLRFPNLCFFGALLYAIFGCIFSLQELYQRYYTGPVARALLLAIIFNDTLSVSSINCELWLQYGEKNTMILVYVALGLLPVASYILNGYVNQALIDTIFFINIPSLFVISFVSKNTAGLFTAGFFSLAFISGKYQKIFEIPYDVFKNGALVCYNVCALKAVVHENVKL